MQAPIFIKQIHYLVDLLPVHINGVLEKNHWVRVSRLFEIDVFKLCQATDCKANHLHHSEPKPSLQSFDDQKVFVRKPYSCGLELVLSSLHKQLKYERQSPVVARGQYHP